MNRDNIQKSINIIREAKANQITKVQRFKDDKGLFCLNGLIMEKAGEGFEKINNSNVGVIVWMFDFYGNAMVGQILTAFHNEYADHETDFAKMQQKSLRYLRGLIKK